MSAHVLDFSAGSRARPASIATADVSSADSVAFPPSKRARTGDNGGESAPHDASQVSDRDAVATTNEPEGTLMERLLLELSASAAWKLSRERSIVQNEAFLNEQLEHAVLLSGAGEMTAELSRLPFAGIVDAASLLPQKLQQRVDERVRHAMDVVSWLLVVRQHDMRRQDELLEKLRMTQKDVERKDHQIQQLRVDVDAFKTQLAQQENMFHGREQALLTERKGLQQDKKYLEVTCAKLQGQETAFKTQLRRKDVEYERLKKSLQDAVQRSAKEQRGMSMGKVLNDLTERRKTAQRVVQSHETQMSRRLVENLERARDDLLFENEALAKNFELLQKTVESVNSQYKKAVSLFLAQRGDGGNTDETWELARVPLDDFTPAPLQLGVKANVPAYIAETVHKLGDKVRLFERAMQAELDYATEHPSEEVVALLKHKLAEAENVIAEQDRLVQALLLESTASPAKKPSASGPSQHEKENVHVNTGKRYESSPLARAAGRRRHVEHLVLEEWEDDLHTEFQALRRKNQHLNDERKLLQSQGEKLDLDRIAFEARNFEHFFGRGIASVNVGDDDIVMQDIDCPASPRTATYLRSIGIFPSEIE